MPPAVRLQGRALLQQQKLLPLAGLRFSTVEPTPAVNPLSTAIVAFEQRLCLSELWKPAQKKKKKRKLLTLLVPPQPDRQPPPDRP